MPTSTGAFFLIVALGADNVFAPTLAYFTGRFPSVSDEELIEGLKLG
jgi:hypothetical protein